MHVLYSSQVRDQDLTSDQLVFLNKLRAERTESEAPDNDQPKTSRRGMLKGMGATLAGVAAAPLVPSLAEACEGGNAGKCRMSIESAQNWVTAFFEKGAEEVLGYYADDFVWEDIQFLQTITTKEELYKAFVVFNNSGPDSPFGVHRFEVLRYDGGPAGENKATQRQSKEIPASWTNDEFRHYESQIMLGSDLDYDEWGYLQWVWKAQHNSDFFGIPAAGQSTVTRGVTFQCYKKGKIVRCQTFWNFRDFAIQLGVVPGPDHAWRKNPELKKS